MALADYHQRVNLGPLRVVPADTRVIVETGCVVGAAAEAGGPGPGVLRRPRNGSQGLRAACSCQRYDELLSASDLAWLPLEPTRFNPFKSDLRFLERAAHAVAAVASPTVYAQLVRHGETGMSYESTETFAAHLVRLFRAVPFRRRLAENARRFVAANRSLASHFHQQEVCYKAMLQPRTALHLKLKARVPELF
jgi:hypothetical protein